MERPILDFPPNEPVDLTLKYVEGRTVKNGQVMYTVIHQAQEKVMFLAAFVAAKIAAARPAPGQFLRITKQERTDGKRGFVWDVQKLGEQGDGTYVLPKAGGPQNFPSLQPAAALTDHQKSITAPVHKPAKSTVESHCRRLIDLQSDCLQYAAEKHGGAVSREDIRSIVLSVYIQAARSGQLRPRPVRKAG